MGRLFRHFLFLEGKRAWKIIPQYYLGTALLVALFVVVTLTGNTVLNDGEKKDAVSIALVMNDPYLKNYGMDVLQSASSATSIFSFIETTEEEGRRGLSDGRYDGVMVFPENFVDGVFGDDSVGAATMYSPKMSNSLNQGLMEGIVEVGTNLLGASAAYVNSALFVAEQNGVDNVVRKRMQAELETKFADRVINREQSFVTEDASGTFGQTLIQYYFCAGIVMLLMLGGVACGTLLKSDARSLEDQLAMRGIGPLLLATARYLAVLALFFAFYLTVFGALFVVWLRWPDVTEKYFAITKFRELWFWFVSGLPVLLLAAAIVLLVYTLAANQIGGILLLFLVTLLMGYASGCIVPSAYLPKAVRSVGRHLPTATMLHVSVGGLTQIADKAGTWLVLAEAATGFAVTAALMKWNRWRAQR
ncbi:MAG: ABC transporter permease [Lachnospiraceae bacterium]|nr:ABC transporter permease [Lachnospiraceae bacterium]